MTTENCSGQHKIAWAWPVLLTGTALYLYANLFAFPNIPFHLDGDQTFFWVYALRMLHGDLIYRDFFQFTPPGADLFFLGIFKLFGPRIWVMNSAVLLLGVALCAICFSIARQLMDSGHAFFAAALVLVFAYGRLLDATHHWFSLLALLCAVRTVMPGWTVQRLTAAGTLLAVASFFTQTVGAAGLIALLLSLASEGLCARRSWRIVLGCQLLLLAAFGLVLGALNIYLIAKIGWQQLWYFQVSYPAHYVEYGHRHLSPGLHPSLTWQAIPEIARRVFTYGLLIIIYPWALWSCWRKRCSATSRNAVL